MGFLSSLFGKPIVMEDEFFGRLTLEACDHSTSGTCFYAENVRFPPTDTEIDCMIDADRTGPTLAQRGFFQRFEKQYIELLPEISALVEVEFKHLVLDFPIENFESTHRLSGLSIPRLNAEPVEWELWFEPIDESTWGYTVTVCMHDDIPQPGIGISS